MADDSLREYRRRRDFGKTAEPRGDGTAAPAGRRRRFVLQIHDASTAHFDFRLEAGGVLKSWAVPKGVSADPHDRSLALPTEDHPVEYLDFEGVIAEGEYGAGAVIIWDEGTYRNTTSDRRGHPVGFARALKRGHVSFWLEGTRLRGGYALTRIRKGGDHDREAWLLVKRSDSRAGPHHAPDPRRARSVRTRRTVKQVAARAEGKAGR